ncbi:MAG: DUF1330 domain-containing protein [Planctomycetaceae bacterium]|nr:DUF1330 domain-containing protein [Planctomycetaceae bacterium]
MAAYLIAFVDVTDPQRYARYTAVTPGIIKKFGGRFLVRGGEVRTAEGPPETRRLVVIEFDSMQRVQSFYDSPEYQQARLLRVDAAIGTLLLAAGVEK